MMITRALFLQVLMAVCVVFHGCSGGGGGPQADDPDKGGDMPQDPPVSVNLAGSRQGLTVGLVDVDGDGIDDMVVGAPHAASPSFIGALLVHKGGTLGHAPEPDLFLRGDDNFGCSFVNLGDVDGDGKEEFAVGAMNGDGEEVSLSGSVGIFRGGSGGQILRKLAGEGPMDKFGLTLAAGNLTGSGKKALIVGAPFATADPAVYQGGAVYVYLAPDFDNPITIRATSEVNGLGWAMAAGDINGDGIDDLLIAASGKVLGFYGGPEFNPSLDVPDVIVRSTSGGFGQALAVVGDLDGDGYGEIAIGAPFAAVDSGSDTGSLYLVSGAGPHVGPRIIDADADSGDLLVRMDGTISFGRFGAPILPLGDLDGDSKPDFAVGAIMANAGFEAVSGKIHLFLGKNLEYLNGHANLITALEHRGVLAGQRFGTSMAIAKDGALLMIGAPGTDSDTGRIYMVAPLSDALPGSGSDYGSGDVDSGAEDEHDEGCG